LKIQLQKWQSYQEEIYFMHRLCFVVVSTLLVLSSVAFAQPIAGFGSTIAGAAILNPGVLIDAYQIDFLPSAPGGGPPNGYVDITNAGELGADPFGPLSGTTGRICANVYVFTPDEEESECCSCLVTPNALVHLTAADLTGNSGNGVSATSGVVVKLLATIPGPNTTVAGTNTQALFNQSSCNAALPFTTANLAPGMRAWTVTAHTVGTATVGGKSPFQPALLSPGEITKLTFLCGFLNGNQSGAGICKSCTLGGLGAKKQ
jgi:hypothetical protein